MYALYITVLLTMCVLTQAVPQNRLLRALYSGNNDDGMTITHNGDIESTYLVPAAAANMDKRDPLSMGKKYDRNCFFSPVQCMLSFNNQNQHDDAIWNSRGRR